MTYIEDRIEVAPEQWVREPDATAEQLDAGRALTAQKVEDFAAIADLMRTVIRDATLAGQDLITVPTATLDVLVRVRDDAPEGFHLPVQTICAAAVAEGLDQVELLLLEPDTVRWPLLVRWPREDDA